MVSFREVSVVDESAHALLTEYFAARAQSFPSDQGGYITTFPTPGDFVAPRGIFLVVEGEDLAGDGADVGCGGIRFLPAPGRTAPDQTPPSQTVANQPNTEVRFEVKHLWLQPHTRGLGYGRALLAELERRARAYGATALVLDTNASLEAAGNLYRSSGFFEVAAYNSNPNATTWYSKPLR